MIKEMICIQCPRGCHLKIDTETLEVTGNFCPRGAKYAVSELTHPERTLTTTVKVLGGHIARASCRSDKPLPKEKIFEAMEIIDALSFKAPVKLGDVLVENILGTGFKGEVRGSAAEAIKAINKSGAYVISVDINSGMNGDTGEAALAVRSDLTVSIGYYKQGLFRGDADKYIKDMTNVDIGIILLKE